MPSDSDATSTSSHGSGAEAAANATGTRYQRQQKERSRRARVDYACKIEHLQSRSCVKKEDGAAAASEYENHFPTQKLFAEFQLNHFDPEPEEDVYGITNGGFLFFSGFSLRSAGSCTGDPDPPGTNVEVQPLVPGHSCGATSTGNFLEVPGGAVCVAQQEVDQLLSSPTPAQVVLKQDVETMQKKTLAPTGAAPTATSERSAYPLAPSSSPAHKNTMNVPEHHAQIQLTSAVEQLEQEFQATTQEQLQSGESSSCCAPSAPSSSSCCAPSAPSAPSKEIKTNEIQAFLASSSRLARGEPAAGGEKTSSSSAAGLLSKSSVSVSNIPAPGDADGVEHDRSEGPEHSGEQETSSSRIDQVFHQLAKFVVADRTITTDTDRGVEQQEEKELGSDEGQLQTRRDEDENYKERQFAVASRSSFADSEGGGFGDDEAESCSSSSSGESDSSSHCNTGAASSSYDSAQRSFSSKFLCDAKHDPTRQIQTVVVF